MRQPWQVVVQLMGDRGGQAHGLSLLSWELLAEGGLAVESILVGWKVS